MCLPALISSLALESANRETANLHSLATRLRNRTHIPGQCQLRQLSIVSTQWAGLAIGY